MVECIFCDIYKNKTEILYENESCFVILDKYPNSRGHSLVIPKEHYENMLETPDKNIELCFKTAKYFGIHLKTKLNLKGLNINTNIGAIAKQEIMHFHIHVIPRYKKKVDFVYWKDRELSIQDNQELIDLLKTDII